MQPFAAVAGQSSAAVGMQPFAAVAGQSSFFLPNEQFFALAQGLINGLTPNLIGLATQIAPTARDPSLGVQHAVPQAVNQQVPMQLYSGHAVQENASFIGYLQQQPISAAIAELPALTGGQSPMTSDGAQEGSKQPALPGHSSTGGQHPMQSEGTQQRGTEKESDPPGALGLVSPCLTNRIKNRISHEADRIPFSEKMMEEGIFSIKDCQIVQRGDFEGSVPVWNDSELDVLLLDDDSWAARVVRNWAADFIRLILPIQYEKETFRTHLLALFKNNRIECEQELLQRWKTIQWPAMAKRAITEWAGKQGHSDGSTLNETGDSEAVQVALPAAERWMGPGTSAATAVAPGQPSENQCTITATATNVFDFDMESPRPLRPAHQGLAFCLEQARKFVTVPMKVVKGEVRMHLKLVILLLVSRYWKQHAVEMITA